MKSNSRILVSLLAGVAAGAVAGLFLAPKAGKDTLHDLSDTGKNWQDQLAQQWGRLRGKGSNGLDKMESRRNKFVSQAREQVADLPHRPRVSDMDV